MNESSMHTQELSSIFNEKRKQVLFELKSISSLVSNISIVGDFIVIQFRKLPSYKADTLKQHFCEILSTNLHTDIVFMKQEIIETGFLPKGNKVINWLFERSKR